MSSHHWRVDPSALSLRHGNRGLLVVGLFAGITGAAMLTGHWHNAMSSEEYLYRFQRLDSYQHFQGQVPEYCPND